MAVNGSYIWKINSEEYHTMMKAEYGDMFLSDQFEMAKLQWKIECYPAGRTLNDKGSFMVFLKLLNMPNDWQSVMVQRRIECLQTGASFTFISTYTHDNSTFGWPSRSQLLSELVNECHISISIKILKVIDKNSKQILYQYLAPTTANKQTIKWSINKSMMKQFKSSNYGKRFSSQINEDSIFIISCYPNGYNKKCEGCTTLCLQLVDMPIYNATKMKCKMTLKCLDTGKSKTNIRVFDFKDRLWGCPKFCRSECLFDASGRIINIFSSSCLTFVAEICILSILDKDGNEINSNEWSKIHKKYDYEDCFGKKQDESEESHSIETQKYLDDKRHADDKENNDVTYVNTKTTVERWIDDFNVSYFD